MSNSTPPGDQYVVPDPPDGTPNRPMNEWSMDELKARLELVFRAVAAIDVSVKVKFWEYILSECGLKPDAIGATETETGIKARGLIEFAKEKHGSAVGSHTIRVFLGDDAPDPDQNQCETRLAVLLHLIRIPRNILGLPHSGGAKRDEVKWATSPGYGQKPIPALGNIKRLTLKHAFSVLDNTVVQDDGKWREEVFKHLHRYETGVPELQWIVEACPEPPPPPPADPLATLRAALAGISTEDLATVLQTERSGDIADLLTKLSPTPAGSTPAGTDFVALDEAAAIEAVKGHPHAGKVAVALLSDTGILPAALVVETLKPRSDCGEVGGLVLSEVTMVTDDAVLKAVATRGIGKAVIGNVAIVTADVVAALGGRSDVVGILTALFGDAAVVNSASAIALFKARPDAVDLVADLAESTTVLPDPRFKALCQRRLAVVREITAELLRDPSKISLATVLATLKDRGDYAQVGVAIVKDATVLNTDGFRGLLSGRTDAVAIIAPLLNNRTLLALNVLVGHLKACTDCGQVAQALASDAAVLETVRFVTIAKTRTDSADLRRQLTPPLDLSGMPQDEFMRALSTRRDLDAIRSLLLHGRTATAPATTTPAPVIVSVRDMPRPDLVREIQSRGEVEVLAIANELRPVLPVPRDTARPRTVDIPGMAAHDVIDGVAGRGDAVPIAEEVLRRHRTLVLPLARPEEDDDATRRSRTPTPPRRSERGCGAFVLVCIIVLVLAGAAVLSFWNPFRGDGKQADPPEDTGLVSLKNKDKGGTDKGTVAEKEKGTEPPPPTKEKEKGKIDPPTTVERAKFVPRVTGGQAKAVNADIDAELVKVETQFGSGKIKDLPLLTAFAIVGDNYSSEPRIAYPEIDGASKDFDAFAAAAAHAGKLQDPKWVPTKEWYDAWFMVRRFAVYGTGHPFRELFVHTKEEILTERKRLLATAGVTLEGPNATFTGTAVDAARWRTLKAGFQTHVERVEEAVKRARSGK